MGHSDLIRRNQDLLVTHIFQLQWLDGYWINVDGARDLADKGDLLSAREPAGMEHDKGKLHITDVSNASLMMLFYITSEMG
jgi:glycerol kinase